tara:strand:- start:1454 stop:2575 length:1122 start_codon:yes stop_codon:yes gene_type:complete
MEVFLLETYYTGSHKQWIDGYKNFSKHKIKILSMIGQFWKWRMHGGAVTLAKRFNKMKCNPDIILCSDMLDLTTFLSLTRTKTNNIPIAIYFHENQLSYPWSPKDRDKMNNRDAHYSFINYSSALSADYVFFNSRFHMNSFLTDLKPFLKHFPDYNEIETIDTIRQKSEVLNIGLDLKKFDKYEEENHSKPLILWNHRWEYDKNPELFFDTLKLIKKNNHDFDLVVLGENFNQNPQVFDQAKKIFEENIIHWGFAKSFNTYAKWLWKASILPVTSNQEFFGISTIEAIYCNTFPILPNRLSYPELIPNKFHKMIIYNNKNNLYEKIVWAIKNQNKLQQYNFKLFTNQYDWKNMAPVYDKRLTSLSNKGIKKKY